MKYVRNSLFLLLAFLLLPLGTQAYTLRDLLKKQADTHPLADCLLPERQWIAWPGYTDRTGWQKLLGDRAKAYIQKGEQYLDYRWQVVQATDYLEYEKSGNRTIMENPQSNNNVALSTLVMAELAEGKGRFTGQIMNGTFAACEMTSWALSAHLSAQKSRRSLPEYDDPIIDLTAGDTGSMLAWIHHFFRPVFDRQNPAVSKRIRYEIDRRILTPYLTETRFWWMALAKPGTGLVNNWNPWCNFNVLQCFLLMENDRKRLLEGVQKTLLSTDQFINYVRSDGACEEGPSYWGHAAGKLYDYLQLLNDATGGKIQLFDEPMIRAMGEYISRSYVGNGWVVNFADASARNRMEIPLIYAFGKAVKSPEMRAFAAQLRKEQGKQEIAPGRDFARVLRAELLREELEADPSEYRTPLCTWYPETEFCYLRNESGIFLAAKGGFNNESHNHNDVGTFLLYAGQSPLFIDAGVGTYTRQTFSNERYSIWTMQSEYHNLPKINGSGQRFGARFKAANTKFEPEKKRFSADIAGAYPKEAEVESWNRSYTLTERGAIIEDRFSLRSIHAPNQIHFLTQGKCILNREGTIEITTEHKRATLQYDPRTFSATTEPIPQTDKRLSSVWGDELYRIVLTAKKTPLSGKYRYKIEVQP